MNRFLLTVALTLAFGTAQAADILTPEQVDATHLLPPPPAPGSAQALAELAELKSIAAARTPAAFAAAAHDAKDETGDIFADAIGPGFDFAKLPATKKMLSDIHDTEDAVSKPAKEFFHRDRPWIVEPSLVTCTEHKSGPAPTSYPSGHATVAYAMGVVLASLIPDKAQAILARSSQFAENRLVCGVHFRSDIAAGEAFGTVIGLDLLQNAQFRVEYDAAAAELSAAHLR
jgi:acid phosphatase (class A)